MCEGRRIKFDSKLVVKLGEFVGSGCQRDVYECDYTYRGRRYVVKRASCYDGRVSNKLEHLIYKHAKRTGYGEYLPHFRAVTKSGLYLLVERCITAEEYHETFEDCSETECIAYEHFPEFMHNDLHNRNWGYTEYDERPVMFDLGYSEDDLSSVASCFGANDREITKRLAA